MIQAEYPYINGYRMWRTQATRRSFQAGMPKLVAGEVVARGRTPPPEANNKIGHLGIKRHHNLTHLPRTQACQGKMCRAISGIRKKLPHTNRILIRHMALRAGGNLSTLRQIKTLRNLVSNPTINLRSNPNPSSKLDTKRHGIRIQASDRTRELVTCNKVQVTCHMGMVSCHHLHHNMARLPKDSFPPLTKCHLTKATNIHLATQTRRIHLVINNQTIKTKHTPNRPFTHLYRIKITLVHTNFHQVTHLNSLQILPRTHLPPRHPTYLQPIQ